MRNIGGISAFAVLMTLIAVYSSYAVRNPSVGSVVKLSGIAERTRNRQLSIVVLNSDVLMDDDFATKRSSSIVLALDGGSQLELGESTSIKIDQHILNSSTGAHSTLIKLLPGRLRSIVPFVGAGSYRVSTANAICGVRGTDFVVTFIQGVARQGYRTCLEFTDVDAYGGVVEVANQRNPSATIAITSGYSTTVACDEAPTVPRLNASRLPPQISPPILGAPALPPPFVVAPPAPPLPGPPPPIPLPPPKGGPIPLPPPGGG